jgi:hypothetical protein
MALKQSGAFDLAQHERKLIALCRKDLEMTIEGMLSTNEKGFDLGTHGAGRSQKKTLMTTNKLTPVKNTSC